MRLIDADALIEELHFCGEDRAISIVDSSPTVADIVRCKDCEYYNIPTQYRYTNSKLCCRSALQKVKEDDFCAWGERIET